MWRKAMLKPLTLCSVVASSILAGLNPAGSSEFGTAEQAKAMLVRAIDELKADKLIAIAEFNHNDPRFRDRDLFVFCFDGRDGKFTAHESLVAHDVHELRDAYGAPIGTEIYSDAKDGRVTEVAFISPVPGSTEFAVKTAYVTRIGDQVCGVSAYQADGSGLIKAAQPQRW
jgi:hypothetical protein